MRVRRRVWEPLEIAQPGGGQSRALDLAIRGLIALNVLSVILETVPEVEAVAGVRLRWFALLAILLIAMPTAILGSSFVEELDERKNGRTKVRNTCPDCGGRLG